MNTDIRFARPCATVSRRLTTAGALVILVLLSMLTPVRATADPIPVPYSPAPAVTPASGVTGSAPDQRSGARPGRATALVRHFYRVFDTGDVATLPTVLTGDWVDHPLADGQQPGRDGLTPVVRSFRSVFPDLHVTVEQIIPSADGRYVTVRTVWSGTQRAPFLGLPATGARVSFRTTDIHRISKNRIAETWHLEDTYGLYQTLLAAPRHHR